MLAASALTLSTALAAGSVVDLGAKAEVRTSILSAPVADGFGNTLFVVGLTPSVRAAYQGQGVVLDANYAPSLSLIYPSSDFFLVLHRGGGRADWTATSRLRLSADIQGAIGDLDAGTAQRQLGARAGALVGGGNLTQFPFADVVAGGTAFYRHDARFTWNVDARVNATGSPSPSPDEQLILPPQVRPESTIGLTYLLSSTDSLSGNVLVKGAAIADKFGVLGGGGGYGAVTPSLTWNRTLMNGVVASTRGGWLTGLVDDGKQRDLQLVGLPLVDGRLQAAVNLSGEAAIEGTLLAGVGPFSDPLGGLLEERVSGGVQGAWRVNRQLTFTTSATAFGTLYAIGGNVAIAQESQTSVGGTFGVAYNLTEWISLTGEGLGTSRVIADKFGAVTQLAPELTVLVGISGAFNAFNQGERPAGTDPRPGRSIGTRPVSLPGSSKAFSGKDEDADDKKKKKEERSSFRQQRGPEAELDADDVLDRRRRGLTVDERRLVKKKAAKKADDDADKEKKNKGTDKDDDDKSKKSKDGKKIDKKAKGGKDVKKPPPSSTTVP